MKKEFKYQEAKDIADKIVSLLSPCCDKVHIAGSIRREKPIVGDVEICCLPKTIIIKDLFGGDEGTIRTAEFYKVTSSLGENIKGNSDGRYMQILLSEDIYLDLFIPEPYDYFRNYVIRTGSADYSSKVVASAWVKNGWCGVPDIGLRKISDCEKVILPNGKTKWKLINKDAEPPPSWDSEESFFEWLGIKWIEPKLRNI